jgi:excisionase family DNA binding protein
MNQSFIDPTAQPMNTADNYLTKREIAQRLRKEPRTIDNWMRRGILPYYKLGRTVAFKWSDVQAHLDTNYRVCRRNASSINKGGE